MRNLELSLFYIYIYIYLQFAVKRHMHEHRKSEVMHHVPISHPVIACEVRSVIRKIGSMNYYLPKMTSANLLGQTVKMNCSVPS